MISSFISSDSFDTLCTIKNSPCLRYESVRALEINTSILFNLSLANNTILSYYFVLYVLLIIDLYVLIAVVIGHIFNPISEFVTIIVIPGKEAKAVIQIHPVTN